MSKKNDDAWISVQPRDDSGKFSNSPEAIIEAVAREVVINKAVDEAVKGTT
jgi:hypothetical protein